jgi:Bax protein
MKLIFLLLTLLISKTIFAFENPDFSKIKTVSERKSAFFAYILPMINEINIEIISKRNRLINIAEGKEEMDYVFISSLFIEYKIDTRSINDLLLKIDIIPPSLALAQAAYESNWGRSRFMKEGNSIFGEWCYTINCGIVPIGRKEDKKHEVRSFKSPIDSVRSYVNNLNKRWPYKNLREIRFKERSAGRKISGNALANGLTLYSQRAEEYIKEIQLIIAYNNLESLDLSKHPLDKK